MNQYKYLTKKCIDIELDIYFFFALFPLLAKINQRINRFLKNVKHLAHLMCLNYYLIYDILTIIFCYSIFELKTLTTS